MHAGRALEMVQARGLGGYRPVGGRDGRFIDGRLFHGHKTRCSSLVRMFAPCASSGLVRLIHLRIRCQHTCSVSSCGVRLISAYT